MGEKLDARRGEQRQSWSQEWSGGTQANMLCRDVLRAAVSVFDHLAEGIIITDADNRIVYVNAAFTNVTGYSSAEVLGKNPSLLNSGKQNQDFYRQMWDTLSKTGQWKGEIWNKRKNGEIYREWLTITSLSDDLGQVKYYVGIFIDITVRKKFEDRLKHHAYYDFMTDLPNRLLFHETLQAAMVEAKRHRQMVALLFIDLDHFNEINDSLGHAEGDRLLQHFARRLQRSMREGEMVFRWGGDEFIALLPAQNHVQEVAQRVRQLIRQWAKPFSPFGKKITLTASVGISLYPLDGENVSALLKKADFALFKAKQKRQNAYTFHFYEERLNTHFAERLELEQQLREAIGKNQLILYYQPQMDLQSSKLVGMEALVRWRHPERGLLGPDAFISVAEDSDLILQLGEWVLFTACEHRRKWEEQTGLPLRMAVNLSLRQFRDEDLVRRIRQAVNGAGIQGGDLELELTESAVMDDAEKTVEILGELKSSGVRLSIDDFGTGYSSLSYLGQFPVDTLKIDRSFIRDLTKNTVNQTIVGTIVNLAHSLKKDVVAEGVETKEQLQVLKQMRCEMGQGYLFGKPAPLEHWIRGYKR